MENLLPTVAAADVTSDEFREKTLPYQQWEAERTHVAPGTPLDVRHLLPPIGSRKTRRALSETTPIAPHAEPTFPRPAPVDRNLSDLYDPALDPSPIGMEDRGIVQQIRSTRIVPRRESSGVAKQEFSRGGGVARQAGSSDCGSSAIVVTVLNGYSYEAATKLSPAFGSGSRGGGGVEGEGESEGGGGGGHPDCDEPCCVDVFVQGFSTGGIEHAALAPSAVFRRALHRRPMSLAAPEISSNLPEEAREIIEVREGYLGLTVFLARSDDWSDYENAHDYSNGDGAHRRGVGTAGSGLVPESRCRDQIGSHCARPEPEWGQSELWMQSAQSERAQSEQRMHSQPWQQSEQRMHSEPMQRSKPVQQSESITRIIFEREDGTPGPSQNAFRVQFEPGPLGMELEEDPDQRGVVRIRRLLQAGQAEHDGRFSVGCLIVAVGDWAGHDDSISDDIGLDEPSGPRGGRSGRSGRNERSTSAPLGIERPTTATRTCPMIIRSLRQLEEAVSNRKDGHLFVVWALDRLAPEAIAALGIPRPTTCARKLFHRWPSNLLHSRHKEFYRTEATEFESGGRGAHGHDHSPTVVANSRGTPYSARTRFSCGSGDGTQEQGGGAPRWWQSNRAFGGKDRSEFLTSSDKERVPPHDCASGGKGTTGATGASRDHQDGAESEDDMVAAADGYPPNSALGTPPLSASRKQHIPRSWTGGSNDDDDEITGESLAGGGVRGGGERGGGGGTGEGGGWEFETGGGIFDEDDQGLASRKQPRRDGHVPESTDEPDEEKTLLPLGLQASIADDVAVCLWFCNNHESATMKVSWIDYGGKRVLRGSLGPGAFYFERSFATHPWVVEYSCNDNNNGDNDNNDKNDNNSSNNSDNNDNNSSNDSDNNGNNNSTGESNLETTELAEEREPKNETTTTTTTASSSCGQREDNGDCCVVRLGNAMAAAQFSGSLIWNPARKTLSVTKQARVGVSGTASSAVAAVGVAARDGAGLDPGKKRLCMAGAARESDVVRGVAERASVRAEKARILEEMRTWRTQPPSRSGAASDRSRAGGLGQGAPNLRIVMMGSSECSSEAR